MNNGQKIQIKIPPTFHGKPLRTFLEARSRWFAGLDLEALLEEGGFLQQGKPLRATGNLDSVGDLIVMRPPWEEPPIPGQLSIIYEDADLFVVDKWAGIPVTPSGLFFEHALLHQARRQTGNQDLSPLHRLDLETSGVMMFGKRAGTRGHYQKAFQEGRVTKFYQGLVFGQFDRQRTMIDLPLGRDDIIHTRFVHDPNGKPAQTRILEVNHHGVFSLLHLQPLTGRTNQIRAHLAAVGHPIVGDKKYQKDRDIFFRFLETRDWQTVADQLRLEHQALHCEAMELHKPDGSILSLKSQKNPSQSWLEALKSEYI